MKRLFRAVAYAASMDIIISAALLLIVAATIFLRVSRDK